jgi:hypothetical protein
MVALGRMVVNHVQDYFDARPVQAPHHSFEFPDLLPAIAAARIPGFRGEEIDGVVAPVIAKTPIEQVFVIQKSMHRH